MIIDITKLKSGIETSIPIDEIKTFDKEELAGTDLLELNDVKVVGEIKKDTTTNNWLHISVSGTMILPCAVTLKPVPYPFSFEIDGSLEKMFEDLNDFIKKNQNTIDILPIIWENILMEIPMRVVSEDASYETVSGEGWRLITNEEESRSLNPELQKLEDLLK